MRGGVGLREAAVFDVGAASADLIGESSLNSNSQFDLASTFNNYYGINPDANPYYDLNISSNYFDHSSFTEIHCCPSKPIILNLNIQSLQSKFESLKQFVAELTSKGTHIIAITLQEIWKITDMQTVTLDNFILFTSERKLRRGGGLEYIFVMISLHLL